MTTPCTQWERIMSLEVNSKNMAEKLEKIEIKVDHLNDKFDVLLDKMEKKFASKWTERVIKGMVGLVLLSVFWAVIHQVIIK